MSLLKDDAWQFFFNLSHRHSFEVLYVAKEEAVCGEHLKIRLTRCAAVNRHL